MGKKMYDIGLMAKASEAEYDYFTADYEEDTSRVAEARKRAKELSKKCPFNGIVAIEITCYSDEGDELTHYWIHWKELYENGVMVYHYDF